MPSTIEDDLARTFSDAAQAAPAPRSGFAAGVQRRRRQRRLRRLTAVGTLSALAVVALAAPIGVQALGRHDRTTAQQNGVTQIDLASAGQVDRVWPRAVTMLPEHLPDGRGYTVVRRLDQHRLLVSPENPTGGYEFPLIYDPGTGATTELMTDRTATFAGVSANDRQIVWTAANGPKWTVYTAPTTGGAGVVRATLTLPGGDGTRLVEPYTTAAAAYFTVHDPADPHDVKVYRLPDTGAPQVLPANGKGLWWFRLPDGWALDNHPATPEAADRYWNIETGEHRVEPPASDPAKDSCEPTLCSMVSSGIMTVHRPGGAPLLRLTGLPAPYSPRMPGKYLVAVVNDRFVVIQGARSATAYLVDLQEKQAGALPHDFTFADALRSPTALLLAHGPAGQQVLELSRI